MKCKHPDCPELATGMTVVVAHSGTFASPKRERAELTTEIITCRKHAPPIGHIGSNMKRFLKDKLKAGHRIAPLITYDVEFIALDSEKAKAHFAGKPN